MSAAVACERETLARSLVGFVDLCSCGSIHLGVGPLTLRIDPTSFDVFAEMVAEGRERLRRGAGGPASTLLPSRVPHDVH